jgi:hypothetical protein
MKWYSNCRINFFLREEEKRTRHVSTEQTLDNTVAHLEDPHEDHYLFQYTSAP